MPRVKNGVAHHARKKKIMEAAKGARGGRSKLYKAAKETAERAMRYAYRDRRKKKGEFRALWITRINAAARMQGMSYSRLMAGLRKAGVEINRKVLADLAVHDIDAFAKIAEMAKSADQPISASGPHGVRAHRLVSARHGAVRTGRAAPSSHSGPVTRELRCPTRPAILISTRCCPGSRPCPASSVEALAAELIAVLGRKNGALTEALKSVAVPAARPAEGLRRRRQPAQGQLRGGVCRPARGARCGAARRASRPGSISPCRRAAAGSEPSIRSPGWWTRSWRSSAASGSPSRSGPRWRPSGTTSPRSTSRPTIRPWTCTTRCTSMRRRSRASRAGGCCSGPTPPRCRSAPCWSHRRRCG